jgi:branched-chain amino acid transport system ATP-binding protein
MAIRTRSCLIPKLKEHILASSLTIENVSAGYGAVRVLSDVSVAAGDGETVVLLGTNGNGKSTVIKCVTGQVRPTQGRIVAEIDGKSHDLVGMSTEDIVGLGIGIVPEGRRLFPKLTVEENLLIGAYRSGARVKIGANLDFCFETFPRLRERRKQMAGSMSGGEQQMLALGRALMASPRILIIDEPSVGLAPILVTRVIDKIAELKTALGLTVLMAEQNFQQAIRIADRGYVLVHGKIEFSASGEEDLRNSDVVRKLYLGI